MSKLRRFPGKFFKNLSDDPILNDSVGLVENATSQAESDRFAYLDAIFAPSSPEEPAKKSNAARSDHSTLTEDKRRDYVVNSIFAPPELREETERVNQQLVFVKEHDGTLEGIQEVNALIRKGWRIANAFATGNSAFYKALVLMER